MRVDIVVLKPLCFPEDLFPVTSVRFHAPGIWMKEIDLEALGTVDTQAAVKSVFRVIML